MNIIQAAITFPFRHGYANILIGSQQQNALYLRIGKIIIGILQISAMPLLLLAAVYFFKYRKVETLPPKPKENGDNSPISAAEQNVRPQSPPPVDPNKTLQLNLPDTLPTTPGSIPVDESTNFKPIKSSSTFGKTIKKDDKERFLK